jgi:membrane-associated phospholipid phosphatase
MRAVRSAGRAEPHALGPAGRLERRTVAGWVAAGYAVFGVTYLPINQFSVGRDAHRLFLPGEAAIPLVPEWEYLYLTGYFLPLVLVFALRERRVLSRLVRAFGLTLSVAYTTYLLFPVYFERPVLVVDSVATFLLSLEYLDKSYNHFPSLHVALGWLVYFSCRQHPRCHIWLLWTVLGMSISTIFVRQHYIVDVIYGLLLAAGAWRVAGVELRRPMLADRRDTRVPA